MKKLLQMLLPLVAIVALAMPSVASAQTTCSIKVVGEDGYGDGWNDGSLAIVQGGTTVATFNASGADDGGMEIGAYDSTTVTVSNAPVSFVWTSGDYDEEVTIWIYDGSGALVYTVNEPSAGTIYTMNTPCPTCLAPSGLAASVSGSDVDITWNAGSASSWQIVWGVGAFNPDTVTVNSDVTSTSSYSFTSLEDGMYTAYVRTDCGTDGYSTWTSVQFNIGVLVMNMATSGTQTISTCNGTIYDNGGPNGQYSSDISLSTLVITPTDATQWVSVSGSSYTESTFDYLTIYDGVGTSGEVLWTDNGIDALTNFGPFSSSAITVTFHSDGTVTRDGFQINVSCVAAPACPRPASLVASYVAVDSVGLTWSDPINSNWVVIYGPAGFNPDTAVVNVLNVTDTTVFVENLTANTEYDFYVGAICSDGDTTQWRTVSARTSCSYLDSLPYVYGFEDAATGTSNTSSPFAASCWTRLNNGISYGGYPYISSSSSYCHSGSRGLYWYNSITTGTYGDYQCLVLPGVNTANTPINGLQLKFWAKASSTSYHPVFQVGVMTNPSDINSFEVVSTVNVEGTTWAEYEALLATYDGAGRYVAIRALRPTSSWYAYVDDFTLEPLPTCPHPVDLVVDTVAPTEITVAWTAIGEESEWMLQLGDSMITGITDTIFTITGLEQYTQYTMRVYAVCGDGDTSTASAPVTARTTVSCPWPTNVTATYVSTDSITVSWNAGGEETAWEVVIGNEPPVEVYDTTYTFDGLNSNTPYTIKVRAVCDVEDLSAYTTVTVRTACGIQNLPLNENFDSYASSSYPSCWTRVQSGSYPYITTSYGNCIIFAGTAAVIAPQINAPLNQMLVSFDLRKEGSSSGQMTFGYTSDPVAASDMVVLQTIDPATTATYYHYEYDLSQDTNLTNLDPDSVYYLVWRQSSTVTNWYYWLDNVLVEQVNPCAKPDNFVVNGAVADSVAAQWSETGDATAWQLFVGPVGATPDADSAIDVNDTSYVFTDLAGGVAYDMYVRANCGSDYSNWRGPVSVTPGSYIMGPGNATISMCGGAIYDDGGPTGQYANNFDGMVTIYPAAADSMLTFYGTLAHESCCDHLYIYEGVGDGGNLLWSDQSLATNQTIPLDTCVSGPITIKWHSDGSGVYAGFEIFVSCVAAPQCSPVEALTVNSTPTAALVTWQPGFYGVYSGAMVEYKVDSVDSWTALAPVTGTYAVITGLDPLTNYNVRVTTDCEGYPGGVALANFTTKQFSCEVEDTAQVTTGTIGTGTSETSGVPVTSGWGNTMCQSIYLASELTAMGMGNTITSITYTWTNNSTYAKEFSIYMTNTSASEFSGTSISNWQPTGAAALVYNGPHPTGTSGSVTYQLATPFVWDGSSNICITTTMNQPAGASHSSSGFYGKSTETSPQVYRTLYKYQDSNPLDGSNPASVTPSSRSYNRPNITLSSSGCLQYGTCAAPAVAVTEVTTSTASLAWAPGNTETSWNLYYRMAGETNWSAPVAVTGNSYTVSGLTQGRKYEFKLENACTEGNFANIVEATLLCASISSLPFTENFNGWGTGVTPNCWSNAPSYSSATYGRISGTYNCSGSTGGSVYMYSSSTLSNKTYLALPELDTVTYHPNQLQLVFNLFYTSSSYGRPAIEVGVMTSPNDASSFVTVDTVQHSGALSTWEIFEVPMASYTGNGSYVAVRTAYDSAYSYFYLDDLTLELIPTCPRPDSLTASNATTNSIDLGWHERGGASEWIIEYGPRGFQLGTGTTVVANSNPFTLTGLPSSFQGEYYVKSVCGAGDTGEYSRMGCAFGTTQVPATLPYNYDFENVAEWNNWQTSTNHETNNWYRGTSVADSGNYAMYIAAGDTASYFNYAFNAVVNAAAYRDIDFGPVDSSYTISFRARVGGTTTAAYDGLMVFLVDPSIATVASTSNITSPWGNVNDLYRIATVRLDTTWQTYEASFDTISGIHRVAFFWFNQNTGANYTNIPQPAAVDNIHIKYASCPRPVNLTATVSEGGVAYLSWQGASNANYEITYRAIGDTVNQTVMATTNSYNLTGLQAPADYVFWVRKLCGAGDTSLYSDGYQFTTPCASVTSFPWVESFENEAVFDCWAQEGPGTWLWGTGDYSTSTGAGDGTHNIHIQHSSTGNATKIISPVLQLSGADATLIFKHIQRDWVGDQDELNVYYRTDQASSWVLLANYPNEIASWTTDTITLTNTTATYQIAFEMVDGYGYGVAIDSVAVIGTAGAGCTDPVINMATTVVGENDVTISFSGDATQYEVGYVEGDTWTVPATTLTIADTFYTFSGLTAETQYTFGVRALCSASNMSTWSTVTLTTEAHPCATPTGVSAIDVTYSSATIRWNAGENETEWEVNINSTSPVFDTTIIVQGTTEVTVTGLMDDVDYAVTVTAVCAPGRLSEPSEPYALHTSTCAAPTNLHQTEVTANSATISWQGTAGRYQIEYGMTGFNQGEGTMVDVENTTYQLTGLAPQSPYDVYVRSICAEGVNSTWSTVLQFTTTQVGIDDVNANANISLYPNPASHMVTISGIEGTATVTVIDLNGRQNGQWQVENGELTIDVSAMAKGAYFVRIAGESTVAVRKLVVK